MKKSKIFKTLIGGALAVSMIVPLSISALANDADSTYINDSKSKPAHKRELKDGNFYNGKDFKPDSDERQAEFESILDELVDDGILTSTQVDKMKEMAEENREKEWISLVNLLIKVH